VGEMFLARGYDVFTDVTDLSQANLVCFTGGSDVSPYIYGEEPNGARGCDPVRDEVECVLYHAAKDQGIPCVGICRGGQLLNVLNGGSMIQHLGKTISGDIEVWNDWGDESFVVRVDHHQGMVASEKGDMSLTYGFQEGDPHYEIWYPETKSLCVQYHPEWGHEGTEARFFELLTRYIGD